MDQEKETKRQAERCRALAQRIVRELTPASIQVLGGSGALAEALEKAGAQLLPENAEQGTAALLVVEDPEWVDLPALQCARVLLVCTDASVLKISLVTSSTSVFCSAADTGRFSHALRTPARIFSLLNASRVPSRFTTEIGISSIFS